MAQQAYHSTCLLLLVLIFLAVHKEVSAQEVSQGAPNRGAARIPCGPTNGIRSDLGKRSSGGVTIPPEKKNAAVDIQTMSAFKMLLLLLSLSLSMMLSCC